MRNESELEKLSHEARIKLIKMLISSNSGHPGGSLSIIEILIVLYFSVLNINQRSIKENDKFLLSKGHAAPALYTVLMLKGIVPNNYLKELRKLGSPLQGHPDERFLPQLDFSSGSLGQNLSVGVGYALAQKKLNLNTLTYVLLGDGELQEGQIWEAANSAAHYNLDNLTVIIDYNKLQLDGPIQDVMSLNDLNDKWKSFGFYVMEIDGHDIKQIKQALEIDSNKPKCVIAHTIKGKGISFMEDVIEWHSLHDPNSKIYLEKALNELGSVNI